MFVTRATGLTSARLSAPPPPGGDAAAALQADGVLPHQDPCPAVRRPLRPHGHALRRHHALGSTDLPSLTAIANCWVAAWWRSSLSALTAAASFFGAFSARECFSVPSFWDAPPALPIHQSSIRKNVLGSPVSRALGLRIRFYCLLTITQWCFAKKNSKHQLMMYK